MAPRDAPLDVAQLVADYHQVLYRYAYRLSGTAPDAEDLTQQVFLISQQKLDQLRSAECVGGWLFTILRNCYFKMQRQRSTLPLVGGEFDLNLVPAEAPPDNVDSEALQAGLNALADEFKVVLLMFYFEQRSYREIAQMLDLPIGTVMSRLARGKSHLRRWLVASREPGNGRRHDAADVLEPRLSTFRGPTAMRP